MANFYNANKASFNLAEPQVHLAQILVTPSPDANVRNLKNSKAQNETDAKTKIVDIADRLKRGEDFAALAQNFSEDAQHRGNGGDMGFVPESALEKANPELRKMVMSLQPGGVSPVILTPRGLPHSEGHLQGAGGPARAERPAGAAEHPRNAAQPQGPAAANRPTTRVARNGAKVTNYWPRAIVKARGK